MIIRMLESQSSQGHSLHDLNKMIKSVGIVAIYLTGLVIRLSDSVGSALLLPIVIPTVGPSLALLLVSLESLVIRLSNSISSALLLLMVVSTVEPSLAFPSVLLESLSFARTHFWSFAIDTRTWR